MKINLHNKIEVFVSNKKYVFYNNMYDSVLFALQNLKPYNQYIAIGNGMANENEKTQKLTSFVKKYKLNSSYLQNNIKFNYLYVKKSLVFDEFEFGDEYITELGLCDNVDNNPTIYNYISLISDETPRGIKKVKGEKLIINLYVYLDLSAGGEGLFCEGENRLIGFLLGEGLFDEIYAVRGKNLVENILMKREFFDSKEKFSATLNFEKNEDLILNFEFDLGAGEIDELVIFAGENVVARYNLLNFKSYELMTTTYVSKDSNILDVGADVKEVEEVINISSGENETSFFEKKYACSFGDKISLPFNNLFDYQTPRFLSKDGKMIFFVRNDYVFGYKNSNYQIFEIATGNLFLQDIRKIVSFDKYVFIITKFKPFVHCFCIEDDFLKNVDFNLKEFEYFDELENLLQIDITMSKDNKFMMPILLSDGRATTIYFDFNESQNKFIYDSYILSEYEFSYLIAMYKNNFSDAMVLYLKGGEYSYECRIVTHYADKTIRDVATVLAYDMTHDTKQIYANDRAVVVEKITNPSVYIYYYPRGERYNLPLLENEVDNYFSADMLYLIQKYADGSYQVYNLIGYNNPMSFQIDLSELVDVSLIVDFEFLNDSLLIFLNDKENPILAINLMKNQTMVENVQSAGVNYQVSYKKYNKLGINEGVKAVLSIVVGL